jgi:uncharacterized protein YlxP (DUF503 family)
MALCYIEIKVDLPYSQNLKEKRGIIKSLISRVSKKFNVSISEIEFNDVWKSALLGMAIVAKDGLVFDSMIENIIDFIELSYPDITIYIETRESL